MVSFAIRYASDDVEGDSAAVIYGDLLAVLGRVCHAEDLEFGVDLISPPRGLDGRFRLDVCDLTALLEHGLKPDFACCLVVTTKLFVYVKPTSDGLPCWLPLLFAVREQSLALGDPRKYLAGKWFRRFG